MECINTHGTKMNSRMIHCYSYLVMQSKVKLTHTENDKHPRFHGIIGMYRLIPMSIYLDIAHHNNVIFRVKICLML